MTIKNLARALCPRFLRASLARIEASPFGSRLARGTFWNLAGALISRGMTLLASILVARLVGKVGFGELGIVQSTIGMFGAFAGLGLGVTATKYIAEYRAKDPPRAGRIMALTIWLGMLAGGLLAAALFVTAPWLAVRTLAAPRLGGVLRIGSGLLFFSVVSGAQTGVLSGFEDFKSIARVNLGAGIATFFLMAGGAKVGGLEGALWGLTGSMAVNALLNHLAMKRTAARAGVNPVLAGSRRELPVLWNYSLPALLGSLVVVPATWICNALLVNKPGGYAEMGLFNAANQWFLALMFLPGILSQVALPMLSERLGCDDGARSKKILSLSLKLNLWFVLPLMVGVGALSPLIMSFYGPGFRDAWPTLAVVLATSGLVAVQWPVNTILQASGRMWVILAMNLGWAAIFVGGALLLVRFGALGLAGSRAAAYAFHAGWTYAYVLGSRTISRSLAPDGRGRAEAP